MSDDSVPQFLPTDLELPAEQAGLVETLRAQSGNQQAELLYEALVGAREALAKTAALTRMVAELNAAVATLAKRVAEDHQAIHRILQREGFEATSSESSGLQAGNGDSAEWQHRVDAVWESAFREENGL